MSEQQPQQSVTLSGDEVRSLLVFLSVAKSAYEFVGRMSGDGEERFAYNRMAIESLSIKLRGILEAANRAHQSHEIPAEIAQKGLDDQAAQADIVTKVAAPRDRRTARRRK